MKYEELIRGLVEFTITKKDGSLHMVDIYKDNLRHTVFSSNNNILYETKATRRKDDTAKMITEMYCRNLTNIKNLIVKKDKDNNQDNKEYLHYVSFTTDRILKCKHNYRIIIDTSENYSGFLLYDKNNNKIESIYIVINRDNSVNIIRDVKTSDGWLSPVFITKKELKNIINNIK